MNILMLCGVFGEENEAEVASQSRGPVEYSAELFQRKLIKGFKEIRENITVLSAPFIGAYPTRSNSVWFKGFKGEQSEYSYVSFCNIWGIRNISRAVALKKAVRQFAESPLDEKMILVYAAHTPFLEAAVYAKRIDPAIKICVYVPDLPQYMNLSVNRGWFYNLAKKYDIYRMSALMESVDSFVLLTEQMKDMLPTDGKPCLVFEGIVDDDEFVEHRLKGNVETLNGKRVVYTGRLDEKFGIKDLVDAFELLGDEDWQLVVCGNGDCEKYVADAAKVDGRINYLGQVSPCEAAAQRAKAAILVNPRPNNEKYVEYSFPSKNIEYLMSGKPVVAYLLKGMPDCYKNFIVQINEAEEPDRAIACALEKANSNYDVLIESMDYRDYAKKKLASSVIAASITEQMGDGGAW